MKVLRMVMKPRIKMITPEDFDIEVARKKKISDFFLIASWVIGGLGALILFALAMLRIGGAIVFTDPIAFRLALIAAVSALVALVLMHIAARTL
jgi:hypothetical protein